MISTGSKIGSIPARIKIPFYLFTYCIAGIFATNSDATDSDYPRDHAASQHEVAAALERSPDLKLFTNALKASSLWSEVVDSQSVTLFVPADTELTNEGLAFLLDVVLIKPENSDRLRDMLALHIYPGMALDLDDLIKLSSLSNDMGRCVSVRLDGKSARIGSEAVVVGQQSFANGQIFFIDQLLWQHQEAAEPCIS